MTAYPDNPKPKPVFPLTMIKFLVLLTLLALPAAAQTTKAKYDYFTSVTIPAGQSVNIDSTIDYSSSDTLRVTVRSAASDLLNLLGTAYFTVPNATEFVTQEVMLGTDFFYANSGGATFQVCGPQFRLTLRNTGTTTMTLTSVLIYTHVQ